MIDLTNLPKDATREGFGKGLQAFGNKNSQVVALDGDLSGSTKSAVFGKEHPDRFFNLGICEQDIMATAAGLASCGKIPFACTFAMFATARAFDQIRNSICYPELNVKVVGSHSGLMVGQDGACHQATEDVALMRSLPNMRVYSPADTIESELAVEMIGTHKGPVYLRLAREKTPVFFKKDSHKVGFGKGQVMEEGKDLYFVSHGIILGETLKAAYKLKEEGINAGVINMPSVKPLDEKLLLQKAKEAGAIVTCEDHNILGGLGGAVAEFLSSSYPVPVGRIGVKDTFAESGNPWELWKKYGLDSTAIIAKAKEVLKLKK